MQDPGGDLLGLALIPEVFTQVAAGPPGDVHLGVVLVVAAPADTRKYVIGAFEMLFTKREDRPAKKHSAV